MINNENIKEIQKEVFELELTTKEAIEKLECDLAEYKNSIDLITYVPDGLAKDIKQIL